jgi:SPP1 gp7 family putative phage head morphogenesis protein
MPLWPEAAALTLFAAARLPLLRFRTLLRRRLHLDALEDFDVSIRVVIEDVLREVNSEFPSDFAWKVARQTGERIDRFSATQLAGSIKQMTGVEVDLALKGDAALKEMVAGFARDNARLISDLPDLMADRLGKMVAEAVESGRTQWELADALDDAFDLAEGRASFLARDQTGKLFGQVDRYRQERLGVTQYFWRTMLDPRVRDSHARLEGRLCAWSEPPVNERGEHIIPGSDYNCRCWAEPDLSNVTLPGEKAAA